MSSPEREEVAKQLAEELGFTIGASGTWYTEMRNKLPWNTIPDAARDALISREMRVRELVELFNTPHFLGAPMVGDPITSALDRNAPPPHLSNDTVMVSRDWYEKLSARLTL